MSIVFEDISREKVFFLTTLPQNPSEGTEPCDKLAVKGESGDGSDVREVELSPVSDGEEDGTVEEEKEDEKEEKKEDVKEEKGDVKEEKKYEDDEDGKKGLEVGKQEVSTTAPVEDSLIETETREEPVSPAPAIGKLGNNVLPITLLFDRYLLLYWNPKPWISMRNFAMFLNL